MADLFHGPKAKPAPETYTVTFDANGATNETAPQPIPAIKGSAITLPNEGGLSIDGHTFGGWNANAAGTGDHYTAGSPYTVNGDVTLYAKWNPVLYTVIFDPNGATSGTAPQPIPAIKGSAITLPNEGGPNEGGLSMDGNAFVGWNTNTAGTGNNHSAGSSYTVNEDVTLYAKWNKVLPEERIVRFFTNGGSSVDTQIIETGKTATRPADPDKTGNNFGNWYEEPELITVYDFSTPVFVHINLYAKWNPVLYTVTFNINGGSGTTPPAQTKNAGEAITLPNGDGFSRTGYTSVFGGWNTNAAGTGVNYNFGDSYTVTGDVVLYANWRPYELGETGPGGGKIFFRSGSGFTHYTSRTDTVGITCHYLEAAPANIPAGRAWASTNFLFTHMGTSTAIGTGMRNTLLILKIDITAHAAKACNEYDNNGKSDWFLPSKDELSLLYDNRVDADIVLIGWYWSSSEIDHQSAWCGYLQHNLKHHIGSVLPIRAF
ncbi:MAG: InlB B-repeat-containing protein [Treponema sp.]|nr:InlB B-repeat-containing protein [Treponema sp.]